MRRLGHLILWLAAGLLGALTAVALYLGAAFFHPHLLINATTLRVAAAAASLKGIYLQWDEAKVAASSESTWVKALSVDLAQVCAQMPAFNLSTCMPSIHLELVADLQPKKPQLLSFGPVEVQGRHLNFGPLPAPTEPSGPPLDWAHLPRPAWLEQTQLRGIHVAFPVVQMQDPGWRAEGSVDLKVAAPAPDPLSPTTGASSLIALQLSSFCLREGPVAVDGCLGTGQAAVRLGVVDGVFALTQLGPLSLKAQSLGLRLPEAPAQDAPAAKSSGAASWPVPAVLSTARWMPVQVQIGSWQLKRGDLTVGGKLDFSLKRSADQLQAEADLGRLCADEVAAGVHACFSSLQAGGVALLKDQRLSLRQIGPLRALDGVLHLSQAREPALGAPKAGGSSLGAVLDPTADLVPEWLKRATLAPVEIKLDQIVVDRDDLAIRGAVAVEGRGIGPGAQWSIDAKAASGKAFKRLKTHLQLNSGRGHFSGPWQLDGAAHTDLSDTSHLDVQAKTRDLGHETLGFHLQIDAERDQKRATGRIEGTLDPRGIAAELNGSMAGLVPKIAEVKLHDCRVHLGWRHAWPDQGEFGLGCQVAVVPQPLPRQDEIPLDWPTALTMAVKSELKTPLPAGGEGAVAGQVSLVLVPLKTKQFAATSTTVAEISGSLGQLPSSLHTYVTSSTKLQIPDFAAVVQALSPSRFAVPAPFNVLSGTVMAQINATGDLTNGGLAVPMVLTTRLQSGEAEKAEAQRVATDVAATLHLDPFAGGEGPRLAVQAQLSDVQLALPRITLNDSAAPQILPDKRMRNPRLIAKDAPSEGQEGLLNSQEFIGPPAPPPRSALAYEVQIATPQANPLHLLSNLAKQPVPILVDIKASSEAPTHGHVAVHEFPLNLFRRQAYVDKFDIALTSPEASPTIDGKLRVEYPDYTITILLLGTLKAPEIKLSSEPIRPENQLIAVLLFGKEMSDLDDDQLKSVDNFGGAAADSALSLASMYLLASTPVQSVGYNPQTQAFTAKINVGKGTSINIGSDLADYQKLGVQKRLARGWAVETYIERNADTDTDAVTALLEWSRRF